MKRGKFTLFLVFLAGTLFGAIATYHLTAPKPNPTVTFTGKATLDTASHQDTYLNNAIYLESPISVDRTIYLDFTNDAMMNQVIGKNVSVTGDLTAARLDDGTYVTQLNVQEVSLR